MLSETGNMFMQEDTGPNTSSITANNVKDVSNNTKGPLSNQESTEETRTAICSNSPEMAQIAAKVESIKNWTVNRFKTTKQSVFEQLGKVERTIDTDMENRIQTLQNLHCRYNDLLSAARNYTNQYTSLNNAQRMLAESFYQLSLRELDLKDKLSDHSETLRTFCHHGDVFLRSLNYFVSSLDTLCGKTIKDTMQTIQVYEHARLEFDVHRHELRTLQLNPDANQRAIEETQTKCDQHKLKYESLKEDVRVKLALLDENRLKVMHTQLSHFEKGLHQSFSENIKSLEQNSPSKVEEDVDSSFVRGVAHPGPSSFLEQ